MRSAFSRISARFRPASRRFSLPVACLVFLGVFALAPHAHADGVLTDVESFVAQLIGAIAALFGYIFTQTLLFMTQLLVEVAGYNGFATAAAVERGWVIVRDLTNMFFILVMLVIAFGTILGVEEYSYKRMLPRLLIMAVVINFSKVICGLLIDFSQVIMLTFVNGFSAIAGGNFVHMFNVEDAYHLVGERAQLAATDGTMAWETVGSLILGAILMLIASVAVFIMTLMLVGRIVMLWLLIVLSPLAFFLSAFPKGQAAGAYSQWWKMFGNYVVVGPFIAFFLWLSLAVTASGSIAADMGVGGAAGGTSLFLTSLGSRQEFFSFIISIALLLGGMSLSTQFGAMGGGMMSGAAQWFQKQGVNAVRKPIAGALGGAYKVAGQQARLAEANLAARTGVRIPGFGGYVSKWSAGTEKPIEDKLGRGRQMAVDRLRSGGSMGAVLGTLGATDEAARKSGVFGLAGAVVGRPFRAAVRAARGEATGLAGADTYLKNADAAQTDLNKAKERKEAAQAQFKQQKDLYENATAFTLDRGAMTNLAAQRATAEEGSTLAKSLDAVLTKARKGESVKESEVAAVESAGGTSDTTAALMNQFETRGQNFQGFKTAMERAQGDINQYGAAENNAKARVDKWTQGADRARIKGFAPEVPKHAMDAASSVAMLNEALNTRNKDLIKAMVQKIANDGNVDDMLDLRKHGKGRDGIKSFAGDLQRGGLSQQEAMTTLAELDSVMKSKGNTEYSGNVKGGPGGRLRWTTDGEYTESRGKGGEKGSMHGKLQQASNASLFERSVRDEQTGETSKTIDAAGAALIARHIGDIVKVTSEKKMSGDMMSFFTGNEEKVVQAVKDAGVNDAAAIKNLTKAIDDMKEQMGNLAPKIGDVIRNVEKNRATGRKP